MSSTKNPLIDSNLFPEVSEAEVQLLVMMKDCSGCEVGLFLIF